MKVIRTTVAIGALVFLTTVSQLNCALTSSRGESTYRDSKGIPVVNKDIIKVNRISEIPGNDKHCPDGFQFISESIGWVFCKGELWQTLDGGKTWNSIYSGDQDGGRFVEYSFVNQKLGWSRSIQRVGKTTDGGKTWTSLASPINPDNGTIDSLTFLSNGKTGWIGGGVFRKMPLEYRKYGGGKAGYSNGEEALYGVIYRTDDGSISWQKEMIETDVGSVVSYIYVSDGGRVWATSNNTIFYLDGARWKKIDYTKANCKNERLLNTTGLSKTHGDIFDLIDLTFADSDHGWASFSNGYISRTTDGGSTWCDILDPGSIEVERDEVAAFRKLHFFDTSNGWGLTIRGNLYLTNDGGQIWTRIQDNESFSSFAFLDSKRGWAISNRFLFQIER